MFKKICGNIINKIIKSLIVYNMLIDYFNLIKLYKNTLKKNLIKSLVENSGKAVKAS